MYAIPNMVLEIYNILFEIGNRVERRHAFMALGVAVCLMGAFLMVWGGPVLGENHAGIATVIWIVGIGIIARTRKEMGDRS